MITMWGLFRTYRQADGLAVALQRLALEPGNVNVLARQTTLAAAEAEVKTAPAGGEALPLGLRGLLAGARPRPAPEIGPLLAAGALGRSLARAAAAGALADALTGAGMSPGFADFYLAGLRGGAILFAVVAGDAAERDFVNLFRRHGAEYLAGMPTALTP